MKILHLADTQFDVGQTAQSRDRYDENVSMVDRIVRTALEKNAGEKYDLIVYTGDLTELFLPSETTRKIIYDFVIKLYIIGVEVVFMEGNHDLKLRNNKISLINGEKIPENTFMQTLYDNISLQCKNFHFIQKTGFYDFAGITFALFSHYDKAQGFEYNPWFLDIKKPKNMENVIELFHDPVEGSLPYGNLYKLSNFKSSLVLAGDIHSHQIIYFGNNQRFTYCSSTIARDFGEGIYIDNFASVTQKGAHGFNVITVKAGDVASANIEYVEVAQHTLRTTVKLDNTFIYNKKDLIAFLDSIEYKNAEKYKVRFDLGNISLKKWNTFNETILKDLSEYLGSNVMYEFEGLRYESEEITNDSNIAVNELLSKDVILEQAKKYINALVTGTKIVSEERTAVSQSMFAIFQKEYLENYKEQEQKHITFLKASINNFGIFSENVEIDFSTLNGINRIVGTNGIGKSTLYQFISYMLYDITKHEQNASHRQKNIVSLFNDVTDSDTMDNMLSLSINGYVMHIHKQVKRIMKKGKRVDSDWRDNVSTFEFNYTLRYRNDVITGAESVFSYISAIIPIDVVYSVLFVDSHVINDILKSKSDVLAYRILSGVGITFANDLLSGYDKVRDNAMSGIVKNTDTDSDLLLSVQIEKNNIERLENRRNNYYKMVMTNGNDRKVNLEETKSKYLKTLSGDFYKLYISDGVQGVRQYYDILVSKRSEIESSIKGLEAIIKDDKLHIFDNEILNKKNIEIRKLEDEKLVLENSIKNTENDLYMMRNILSVYKENKATFLRNKEQEIDTQIVALRNSIADIKTKNNTILNGILNSMQKNNLTVQGELDKLLNKNRNFFSTINELGADNRNLESTKNIYVNTIYTLKDKISVSEHAILNIDIALKDKTCDVCGSTLNVNKDAETKHKLHIENVINNNRKNIDTANKDIAENESNIQQILVKIDTNKEEILRINESMLLLKTEISDIKKLFILESNITVKSIFLGILDKNEIYKKYFEYYDTLSGSLNKNSTLNNEIFLLEATKKDIISNIEVKEIDANIVRQEQAISNKSVNTDKENISSILRKIDILKNDVLENDNKLQNIALLEQKEAKFISELVVINNTIEAYLGIVKDTINYVSRLDKIISKVNSNITIYKDVILKCSNDIDNCMIKITNFEQKIEQNKQFRITDNSLRLYKKLVGKNGFVQYIFEGIVNNMNAVISNNLKGLRFYPMFDADGSIKMFDLRTGTVRDVSRLSGMEETFTGLAIINMQRVFNVSITFAQLFIDEITGKLNSGKDLPYKSIDYQQEMANFIRIISQNTNVFIIDHVFDDLCEDNTIFVQPTLTGKGAYITINNN